MPGPWVGKGLEGDGAPTLGGLAGTAGLGLTSGGTMSDMSAGGLKDQSIPRIFPDIALKWDITAGMWSLFRGFGFKKQQQHFRAALGQQNLLVWGRSRS